ncbi:MAG: polysaccharide biosynthesis protein [Clostridium sp.]
MKKQTLIKGTLILGLASVLAKFLGLFFRIPLQMLIGDEGMGYYQMSYPLYITFAAVASGIPTAISKIISEMGSKNNSGGIRYVFKATLQVMIPFALIFSGVMIIFGKQIISLLRWDMKSYYAFIAISIAPILVVIMGTFRGFFQGMQNMNPTAISQVIEQVGRVVFGVGLAYLAIGNGIEYAAGGAALGAVVGGVICIVYLFFTYVKVAKTIPKRAVNNKGSIIKKIICTAIPFSLGAAIGTIMSLVDSILVPRQLLGAGFSSQNAAILYGRLTGKAGTISNVPLSLSMALCASLVPIIAEAYYRRDGREISNKVHSAMKLSAAIALPSAMGIFCLAFPIVNLIFAGDYGGYDLLKYVSLSIPFIILCQTTTAILQAMNNFYKPVKNLAVGCIVKVILTYILVSIPGVNIYGAVLGSICGYVITCMLNFSVLKKVLIIPVNYYETIVKPGFATVIMGISVTLTYTMTLQLSGSTNIACLISVFIGIIIYLIFIVILKVFKYSDIKKKIRKGSI